MRALLAFLLSTVPSLAGAGPSEAALSYLREIAAGRAESVLREKTALSPATTDDRLEEIQSQQTQLTSALSGADFTVLSEKEDGELAGVLVMQNAGPAAQGLEIHTVGMIRRGERWLPAPVLGSFQNTGLGFDPKLLARGRALEDWMMRTRGQELIGLRETALQKWQEGVNKAVPAETLRNGSPERLVMALADAFSTGNQYAIYALLGATEDPRPEDWEEIQQIVRWALKDHEKSREDWGLMLRPEVVRATEMAEAGFQQWSVALFCQDPGPPSPMSARVLHFMVIKGESGLFRIEIPELLRVAVDDPEEAALMARESLGDDAEQLSRFPAKLRELHPASAATDVRAAAEAAIGALREPKIEKMLPLLDLAAEPELAQSSLTCAMKLRGEMTAGPSSSNRGLVPLTFLEQGDEACGIYQYFSPADPERSRLIRIYLRRTEQGWLSSFAPQESESAPDGPLAAQIASEVERYSVNWTNGKFTLVNAPLAEAPTEDAAKALIVRWDAAREKGDLIELLSMTAGIDDASGLKSIAKNLNYEISDRSKGEIGTVIREGPWACVAVKRGSVGLYPVIGTPAGPKVLLELYAVADGGKPADYLRRKIFARAAAAFPGDARDRLEAGMSKYRQTLASPEISH